ncbi:MAG TPA: M20/M25/M40 family metallo-hydrolase [Candidatus Scatavimonas merdigallinarum]|uniref:M20/M25/M40 family metallo-hydrolase n=1 Tax=Candidatus Scatavimonas merdigallinarum TaxID=2840914 RepID=A0A9D0ZGZ4_9FIRM|nr:M20/M25/M40 family metallo-hydrolase [Candidatus Scatavimonas merdigallinarum]
MIETLRQLCNARGVSGSECAAAAIAGKLLSDYAQVSVDKNGNVIGTLGNANADFTIMLDAHLDQIGLIVTDINADGFIKAEPCGGVDRRVLQGTMCVVLGKQEIPCVVCCLPPHLSDGGEDAAVAAKDLWLDTALPPDTVKQLVCPGDRIVFHCAMKKMLGTRITGPALDNRAGVACLLHCAKQLSRETPGCKVVILFSTQEETSAGGAKTASFLQAPDEAIVVDVSFARQSGVQPGKSGVMGKGGMIAVAPTLSKKMSDRLIVAAKNNRIPYQLEVMGSATGTNADAVSMTKGGIPTALLSIPLKNMHTQGEIVDLCDIKATADVLTAYVLERGRMV